MNENKKKTAVMQEIVAFIVLLVNKEIYLIMFLVCIELDKTSLPFKLKQLHKCLASGVSLDAANIAIDMLYMLDTKIVAPY